MTYRPTLPFAVFLIVLALAISTWTIVAAAHQHSLKPEPKQPAWQPPAINCPDNVELWDCIRYKTGEADEEADQVRTH